MKRDQNGLKEALKAIPVNALPISGSGTVAHFRGWAIRVRAVKCGKPNCRKCPHRYYAYAERRVKGKLQTKYVGVIK